MRAHVVDEDGFIINTIEVPYLDFLPGLVDASIGGRIGDRIVDGIVIPQPIPQPPVPYQVSQRQARLALLDAGKLDLVEAEIAAIDDDAQRRRAEIEWQWASAIQRNNPFTLFLAAAIGLSDEELDNLFRTAGNL